MIDYLAAQISAHRRLAYFHAENGVHSPLKPTGPRRSLFSPSTTLPHSFPECMLLQAIVGDVPARLNSSFKRLKLAKCRSFIFLHGVEVVVDHDLVGHTPCAPDSHSIATDIRGSILGVNKSQPSESNLSIRDRWSNSRCESFNQSFYKLHHVLSIRLNSEIPSSIRCRLRGRHPNKV